MKHFIFSVFFLLVVGLTVAIAGLSSPGSHAVLSADGKRLLVMVSPVAEFDRAHPARFLLPDRRSVILHETFSKSGAYDAATLVPIWQCDWYAYKGDLRWSADFTDVAFLNRFGLTSNWALAFYHEGNLVRRYDCQYLLTGLRHPLFLPFATWDWHFRWYDTFELDKNHLVLSTARRERCLFGYKLDLGLQEFYTFEMSTGNVTTRRVVGAWRVWCYGICIVFALSLIPYGLFRIQRRHRRNDDSDGHPAK